MEYDDRGPQSLGPDDNGRCIRSSNVMQNPIDQILRYSNAVGRDSGLPAALATLSDLLALASGTPFPPSG